MCVKSIKESKLSIIVFLTIVFSLLPYLTNKLCDKRLCDTSTSELNKQCIQFQLREDFWLIVINKKKIHVYIVYESM